MTVELGRASPFSSVVAANGHEISDEFRVERHLSPSQATTATTTRQSTSKLRDQFDRRNHAASEVVPKLTSADGTIQDGMDGREPLIIHRSQVRGLPGGGAGS
jgi:hypothetical protein